MHGAPGRPIRPTVCPDLHPMQGTYVTQKLILHACEEELVDAVSVVSAHTLELLADEKGKFVVLRSLESLAEHCAPNPGFTAGAAKSADAMSQVGLLGGWVSVAWQKWGAFLVLCRAIHVFGSQLHAMGRMPCGWHPNGRCVPRTNGCNTCARAAQVFLENPSKAMYAAGNHFGGRCVWAADPCTCLDDFEDHNAASWENLPAVHVLTLCLVGPWWAPSSRIRQTPFILPYSLPLRMPLPTAHPRHLPQHTQGPDGCDPHRHPLLGLPAPGSLPSLPHRPAAEDERAPRV